MRPIMRMIIVSAGILALAAMASPAIAGASNFTLVDGTSSGLTQVTIRRAGTTEWKPLGAPGKVQFADPDCAFDMRATVAGSGPVTWMGVNLCDVKSITLKRDETAGAWVDYDE